MGMMVDGDRVRLLRKAFRHLKRGVFSPDLIDEFTVGRSNEMAGMERRIEDVEQGSSRHVFVEGAYGLGKSHTLKAIEAIALRRGFAVTWVTLDGQNHACNHPTRYFHSLLESLRVAGSHSRGLASLVGEWLRNEQCSNVSSWAKQSNSWLRWSVPRYQRNIESGEEIPFIKGWIESTDIAYRNGKPWYETVSQRMQETAALLHAASYKGVIYLFDEVESVATLLTNIRQRYLSYDFLNLLVDGRKHARCLFVFAATPDFAERLEQDRTHRDRYSATYPEACRFLQKWHEGAMDIIRLRRLGRGDVVNLCERLRQFHGEAFEWDTEGRFSKRFIEGYVDETQRLSMGVRETTKTFVYLLELAEQYRQINIEEMLPRREQTAVV